MTYDFTGRVAIVTGAGNGLGRSHAIALAAAGAHVLVNDAAGSADPSSADNSPTTPAGLVVAHITARGGSAMADLSDVTDVAQVTAMVDRAIAAWGRVDILINNAGILRDAAFRNVDLVDFRAVIDVHLMGAVHCTKAVWDHMTSRGYGRILMTTSASGLYGNFGQASYAAAKSALVGLTNVLAIEGESKGVHVNALAPLATTAMTGDILTERAAMTLTPESVTAAVLHLVSEDAPTKVVLGAGGGTYAVSRMIEARGVYLPEADRTPDNVAKHWARIADITARSHTETLTDQLRHFTQNKDASR